MKWNAAVAIFLSISSEICLRYVWDMSEIYLRYVWDMTEIWLRYDRDMSEICLRYVWDMSEICLRYVLINMRCRNLKKIKHPEVKLFLFICDQTRIVKKINYVFRNFENNTINVYVYYIWDISINPNLWGIVGFWEQNL